MTFKQIMQSMGQCGIALLLVMGSSPSWASDRLAQVSPPLAEPITGQLSRESQVWWDGSYYNSHAFTGEAGQAVTIDLASSDFDTYLILIGPNGQRLIHDDDGGEGTNSRINVILPMTGTYQVLANSYLPAATGTYQLIWSLVDTPPVANSPEPPDLSPSPPIAPPLSIENLITEAIWQDLETSLPFGLGTWLRQEVEEALPQVPPELQSPAAQQAEALSQMAMQYYYLERYSEAEALLEQSLVLWRQELGDRHPRVAEDLSGLALVYRVQGRYDEALPLYEEALSIDREQLGEHPNTAQSLQNLADVLRWYGRYSEAAAAHEEATAIRRHILGDRHSAVAASLHNTAEIYKLLGFYSEAEQLLNDALSIYREVYSSTHQSISNALNDLAGIHVEQGRYAEAEAALEEAIALRRSSDSENLESSANNLAVVYMLQGRYDEAQPLYEEALALRQEQQGDRSPAVAQSLNNLSENFTAQGNYTAAITYAQEGLSIRRERVGDRSIVVAQSLGNLFNAYLAQGNISQALPSLREALDIEEFHLSNNLSSLTDVQRQAYAVTLASSTQKAISLHLQTAPQSSDAAHLALTTLLRRKGRLLDAGIDNLQNLRSYLTEADRGNIHQLMVARQELAAFLFNPDSDIPSDQYLTRVNELEAAVNQLEQNLARQSASFQAETTPVEVAAVQARIPSDGVLVEYVRYQPFDARAAADPWGSDRYAAYLLFPNGQITAVDLGDAATIDTAIRSFIQLLQDRRADFTTRQATITVEVDPNYITNVTSEIRSLVYDPIARYLSDRTHLLISPDSQLNRLPFEALQTNDQRYLVEQYQISYLNSGRDLLRLGTTPPSSSPPVVLANPNYDEAIALPNPYNRRSLDLRTLQVGALPGTAREAEALRSLLPNAVILTESYATEEALKDVQAPAILHIATHGFFLAEQPIVPSPSSSVPILGSLNEHPLLRSGLALAGFNPRRSDRDDGVLTALEAASLNLFSTQLVVLSACDTGIGDIANGEGVYGLRRAFAIAGADTQLMSLWQVSDDGTQSLMARYYRYLTEGMGRGEALRAVQLDMIRQGGEYSHPYYWSAFILTGNWQPLQ